MIKRLFEKIFNKIKKKQILQNQLINKRIKGHIKRFQFYKEQKFSFKKVLDIGACDGSWTVLFKKIFPESNVLMIEGNTDKEKILKSIGEYRIALLSCEDNKEVNYYKGLDGGSLGNSIYEENTQFKFAAEKRTTKTLNSLLGPDKDFDLIKIDVQGSELDIIKGGVEIIKNTKFLLLELQMLEYNKGAPRIEEIILFLKNLDFDFVDIFDLLYSSNGSLVQLDGFFVNNRFNNLKINFN